MIVLLPGNQILNVAHLITGEFTPAKDEKPASLVMALVGVADRLAFEGKLAEGLWELLAGLASFVKIEANGKYTVKGMNQGGGIVIPRNGGLA